MKKVKPESLQNKKFVAITQETLPLITGGGDTGAGKLEVMRRDNNVLTANGYVHVTQTYFRSWTSDSVVGETSCYWGESYYWA